MNTDTSPLRRKVSQAKENFAREPIRLDPSKLRDVKFSELLIRFGFGMVVSTIAGVVSVVFGARPGGVFLAFPAILPASLTLISEKDGRTQAEVDVAGATLGAVALIVFALVSFALLGRLPLGFAQAVAFFGWTAASVALYVGLRGLLRRGARRTAGGTRAAQPRAAQN